MLADQQHPLPQFEIVAGPIRHRSIERSMRNSDGVGRRDDPTDMQVGLIPQLDVVAEVGIDVVQVRVGKLAKKLVHAEIEVGRCPPKPFRFLAYGSIPGLLVGPRVRSDRASDGSCGRRGQFRCESRARDTERCTGFSV